MGKAAQKNKGEEGKGSEKTFRTKKGSSRLLEKGKWKCEGKREKEKVCKTPSVWQRAGICCFIRAVGGGGKEGKALFQRLHRRDLEA